MTFDLGDEATIDLRPTGSLRVAMDVARRLGHPVYDCAYLALAEREHAAFVTANHRLLRRSLREARRIDRRPSNLD